MTEVEESMYWHKTERHQFQNALKHLRTRQGRFDAAMLHLDHPLPGTDLYLDPSDHGAGAERLRKEVEVEVDKGRSTPFWLRLWRLAAARLPPKGRAVLGALMVDWRNRPAGRIAGVDHKTVGIWKIKLKTHFAQCWRAYERDFVK